MTEVGKWWCCNPKETRNGTVTHSTKPKFTKTF